MIINTLEGTKTISHIKAVINGYFTTTERLANSELLVVL